MEDSQNKIIEKTEISEEQKELNNKMKEIFLNSFTQEQENIKEEKKETLSEIIVEQKKKI